MPVPVPKNGPLTYADYLTWTGEGRWEIIEGEVFDMSPAPTVRHQQVLGQIYLQIGPLMAGKTCQVLLAPLDVRLPDGDRADEAIHTVVQPDLLVVCDPDKLDRAGCVGAPDLAVEILSPTTSFKDQTAKLALYQKHGVREYWVVNPEFDRVQVYLLNEDGQFDRVVEYRSGDILTSRAVPAIAVNLERVFAR